MPILNAERRYLKNIEEEGKQEPKAPTLSQTEINKVKKKAETDKNASLIDGL